jgi:hypothetical protein
MNPDCYHITELRNKGILSCDNFIDESEIVSTVVCLYDIFSMHSMIQNTRTVLSKNKNSTVRKQKQYCQKTKTVLSENKNSTVRKQEQCCQNKNSTVRKQKQYCQKTRI